MLDAHAAFLRNNPSYKVTVEGHADERGTPEYNIALGERRANAVKMYLQGKGVSADQISIVSYGKKNQQYWATTKRLMLKTVVPFWFTKRITHDSNFRRHPVESVVTGWRNGPRALPPRQSVMSAPARSKTVTSLERISNAQGQLLNQLQQQLSDNQRDIDSLRGQIRESQYQLNQVVERQKQIYQQMDSSAVAALRAPLRRGRCRWGSRRRIFRCGR